MIQHVVLLKLIDPADAAEAKARLEALPEEISEILTLEVGLDVLRSDASYDVSLVTTHDSLEALAAYQVHPAHQGFRDWIGPRQSARAVVDSEL